LNINDPEASGRERERGRPGSSADLITRATDWSDESAKTMGLHTFAEGTVLYGLWLENQTGEKLFDFGPIPVASLKHTVDGRVAKWRCSDLRVPPWLVGGGIIARFLDRLITHFEN